MSAQRDATYAYLAVTDIDDVDLPPILAASSREAPSKCRA